MSQAGLALVLTTIATAVVHTLIPDHWLPFVLVARAERWSNGRTLMLTGVSALLHVVISIALGLVAVAAGNGAGRAISGLAEHLELLTAGLLVVFGLVYMGWFLVRGGHVHSFGLHPHHRPEDHDELSHAPRVKPLTGYTLAFIVGFNPCVLIIPCVLQAAQLSRATLVAVAVAFAVSTIGSMLIVTILGLRGTEKLTSPFLTRYGEAFSGGLIALTGLFALFVHYHELW